MTKKTFHNFVNFLKTFKWLKSSFDIDSAGLPDEPVISQT